MKKQDETSQAEESGEATEKEVGSGELAGKSEAVSGDSLNESAAEGTALSTEAQSGNEAASDVSLKLFADLIPNVKTLRAELKANEEAQAGLEKEISQLEARLSASQTSFAELTGALAVNNSQRQRLLAEAANCATIDKTVADLQRELKNAGDTVEGIGDLLTEKRAALESLQANFKEMNSQIVLSELYEYFDDYNRVAEVLAMKVRRIFIFKREHNLNPGDFREAEYGGFGTALCAIPRLAIGGIYHPHVPGQGGPSGLKSVVDLYFWKSDSASFLKE